MVVSVNIPSTYSFVEVSPQKPFEAISFKLNREILKELFEQFGPGYFEAQLNAESSEDQSYGVSLDVASDELLDLLVKLTELDLSTDVLEKSILARPLLTELFYRILKSEHGVHLYMHYCHRATHSGIVRSIEYLKQHFKENFNINTVATDIAYMQPSTFFKHFKESTGLSPLQFKKRLRLIEAKRLLELERFTVSRSAYAVGYESLPQFSREFKQLFNISPSQLTGGDEGMLSL